MLNLNKTYFVTITKDQQSILDQRSIILGILLLSAFCKYFKLNNCLLNTFYAHRLLFVYYCVLSKPNESKN